MGATAPVQVAADLFKQELIVGSTGAGNINAIMPTVLNRMLGTKFRVIEGYRSTMDILLAIQRGEVQGICAAWAQFRTYPELFKEGKLRILLRGEDTTVPELSSVPSIYDLTKTEEQRRTMSFVFSATEFGRPYLLPPNVARDRVELLRGAIAAAVKDPELIAETEKMNLDMSYLPPEHQERVISSLYKIRAQRLSTKLNP